MPTQKHRKRRSIARAFKGKVLGAFGSMRRSWRNRPGPAVQLKMRVTNRIPELDGVRGIAVLLVVIYHAFLYNPGSSDDLIAVIRPYGHAGVDLFFVLSGFLITGILLNAKGRPAYFRDFYARRALRIWPLYYLLLFIAFAMVPLLAHYTNLAAGENDNIHSRSKLVYILLLQNLWYSLDSSPTLLAMTWSLAIEEQFYIVWPGLVLMCSRKVLAYILGLVVLVTPGLRLWVTLQGFPDEAIYRMTWFRLDGLSLGALLSLWYLSDWFSVRTVKWVALTAMVVGLVTRPFSPPWMVDSLMCLACFGLVMFAVWCFETNSSAGASFRWGWLRYIGVVSYCLYLVHQPMYYALGGLLRKHAGVHVMAYILVAMAGFAASLGIASVSWYLFESQLLKLRNRLVHREHAALPT
jgi:peptidoglycan/LPS O-acetylase OafA/YrhL